jgi:hypothetical protein
MDYKRGYEKNHEGIILSSTTSTDQIPRHHEHCRRRRICSILLLHLQLHPLIIHRILFNPSSRLLLFQERHNLSLPVASSPSTT